MIDKLLKCQIKGELHTNSVDNFVEKKKKSAGFDCKNSVFVNLVNF
jgi:hypothetical protein